MSARDERLEALFHAALDLRGAEREALLARECGSDAALLAEVRDLLHRTEQSTPDCLRPQVTVDRGEPEPEVIGRYRIVERIGSGGMGVVYVAEQSEPVRRRVALKVVRAGMDTDLARGRFALERQALALMDHPNIAGIHDAGTTDQGRPYYVMEYTPGPSLTTWCDQQQLDVDERLRLFATVCDAVQHAHQRGVIHRDLKPSNVLVSSVSGTPVAKVIDFGIARPTDYADTDQPVLTRVGDVVGTFDYMSPEQALGQDVDTRSDIWSLGVILYELLSGSLPFAARELHRQPLASVQQVLGEVEPYRPSTAIDRLGAASAAIAAGRATDTAGLRRRLRGDLDWIVLKAMAKDRERRYASASEFAADVRRHLGHEPVLAGPPSTSYRIAKFVRRHRIGVVAGSAVVMALGIGLVLSALAMTRARAAESESTARAEGLRRQLYATDTALAQAAVERGDATTSRALLAACPPDLRGFEWYYLSAVQDRSRATMRLPDQDGGGWCMALHPDGRRVVVGMRSGYLLVVDPEQGSCERHEPIAEGAVVQVTTGKGQLLIGTEAGAWSLVDATTFKVVRPLAQPIDQVRRVAISEDWSKAAILGGDRSVQILDLASGTRRELARPDQPVDLDRLVFRPDGSELAAGGADLCVWNVATGRLVMALPEPRRQWRAGEQPGHQPHIGALAFDPDGQRLLVGIGQEVVAPAGNRIEVRQTRTYELEQTVPVPGTGEFRVLALGPDPDVVATGKGSEIAFTRRSAFREQRTVPGSVGGHVTAIVFRADRASFVSVAGGEVKLWPLRPVPAPDRAVLVAWPWGRLLWSADRSRVAIASWMLGGAVVYDTNTFALLRAFVRPHGPGRVLALTADGVHVVACDRDQPPGLHRIADGACVRAFADPVAVTAGAVLPAPEQFLGVTAEGRLGLWDLNSGAKVHSDEEARGPVAEVLPFADGSRVVIARADGQVEVIDRRTWSRSTVRAPGPISAATLSAQGSLFLIGGDGAIVRLDLTSGAASQLGRVGGAQASIDVSPDGSRLLVLDAAEVQLRDASDGRVLLPRLPGTPDPWSAVFRRDGQGIVAAGYGMDAWEIDTPDGLLAERTAVRAGRDAFLRLKARHGVNAAMRAHAAGEVLEPAARAVLEQMLERCPDSPFELNHEAWSRVLRPYLSAEDYRFALTAAETAVRLLPLPELQNTLATACLRAGDMTRALQLSEGLVAAARRAGRSPTAFDLAVLVMAQARSGQRAEAEASMVELRKLCADPARIGDPQAWIFIREAEATLAR